MTEIWKSVIGYEGYYDVSDHGRVRSLNRQVRGKHTRLVGSTRCLDNSWNGYARISLWKQNKRNRFLVHRLVYAAFVGEIPEGKEVNHIDSDPNNNSVDNLEVVTHAENMQHAAKKGRLSKKLNAKQVRDIRNIASAGDRSFRSLGREYRVCHNLISRIVSRKIWKDVV